MTPAVQQKYQQTTGITSNWTKHKGMKKFSATIL